MATYTLEEYYGLPHDLNHHISFDIELNEEQENRLRAFLREKGSCDYLYLEDKHRDIFDIINDAANDAIMEDINSRLHKPLCMDDID